MGKWYQTKEMAKLAKVSVRTIRYYDEIDLLKPSGYLDNGYRQYSEGDVIKLKKIVSLKSLGFNLVEIQSMLEKEHEDYSELFKKQIQNLQDKISEYEELCYILNDVVNHKKQNDNKMLWKMVEEKLMDTENQYEILEHYKSFEYQKVRKELHTRFGNNQQNWYDWIQSNMNYVGVNRILDIGCGDGSLWENYTQNLRNRELYLIDKSRGMIEESKALLKNQYNFFLMDAENLGFQNNFFEMVVANHVIFYTRSPKNCIMEIRRVLVEGGTLYATTYGKNHMRELEDLVKGFDENITLSNDVLYEKFGLDNGSELLKSYFNSVRKEMYKDSLLIDDVEILYEYIISCNGNQLELLKGRMAEFKEYLINYMKQSKSLFVQKEVCIFIAQ